MNEATTLTTTSDVVTEQDKGRCARAPGSATITLEEATHFWQCAMDVLKRYPEARQFQELRKKWSKVYNRRMKLEEQLAKTLEKERRMYETVQTAKATLPAEVRTALC
jgi:hypothetical protein